LTVEIVGYILVTKEIISINETALFVPIYLY